MMQRYLRFACLLLSMIYLVCILADFVGPYDEGLTHRDKLYHPPTCIHWYDEQGHLTWPFVYNYVQSTLDIAYQDGYGDGYMEDKAAGKFYIKLLHHGEPYKILGWIPTDIRLFGVDQPAVIYLFGADHLGRDMVSRLLHGGRRSLFVGLVGMLISCAIGTLYGSMAGYFGGKTDAVLMRIAEIMLCIPSIYLLIALGAVLPVHVSSSLRYFLVVCIISLVGWAGIARVVRGIVLDTRRQDFIESAVASGAGDWWIIRRHILPNTLSIVLAHMTLLIPGYILSEAALSFLGLGIQEPEASWGNMLSSALNIATMTQYPWILAPGVAIWLVAFCWSVVGDAVRDGLDPHSRTGSIRTMIPGLSRWKRGDDPSSGRFFRR